MKIIKKSILISFLSICVFTVHAESDKQEMQDSLAVINTLRSFDDTMLQQSLRVKSIDKELLQIGRNTLIFLDGIDRVKVILPQLEKYGLTEETVKTGIELRLRRNGIRVYDVPTDPNGFRAFTLSHSDIRAFSLANLGLIIDVISSSQLDVVAADITLSQGQLVNLLSANKPTYVYVDTWRKSQQVIGSSKNIVQGCKEAIDELIDLYCNDYLAVHTIVQTIEKKAETIKNGSTP